MAPLVTSTHAPAKETFAISSAAWAALVAGDVCSTGEATVVGITCVVVAALVVEVAAAGTADVAESPSSHAITTAAATTTNDAVCPQLDCTRHPWSMRIESSTSAAKSGPSPADGSGNAPVVMTTTVPSRSRTH